ncbi:tetratricopeptide repeat protein [Methylomicrobium sp. RS1]|uniref:tetratricopeptide repeat protein n=1 Tax=Candidatus Methylomicrobium oryzae TaxID=2802053 RepID=UPI001922027F|nr:tetratricopeptide repeat protein [Methylomicrobium sp. RS1]MBL1263408.1 tetratricopeptide repeat protein [Methylomicrobium sp. RS1]
MLTEAFYPRLKLHPLVFLAAFCISALAGCAGPSVQTAALKPGQPLFAGLGTHRYPVTTHISEAQRYFDQGLILAYGFNHQEAARSFREAYRLDPDCALCYWGESLVLGPNINAPMSPADVPAAYRSLEQAKALAQNVTPKEQALISALAKRYSQSATENRKPLDEAYAKAMREVAARFPDDADIAALFAESLMDLHPWNFWTKRGEARPWTPEIVSALEHALAIDSDNPLANHLYIHALEASPNTSKALPSARRLPSLVPGSGHLVHMPAHIYIRIGHYRDAILANQQAVKVDKDYLSHAHQVEGIYKLAYVPHNYHFLWSAATKTGQKRLAEQAAADTATHVSQDLLREPALTGTLQHFLSIPLYTKALFGEWDAIIDEPAPPPDLLYLTAVWHYARGMALLRKDDVKTAQQELAHLEQILDNPAILKMTLSDKNPVTKILQIAAEMLEGEITALRKDYAKAIAHLRRAVEIEDGLNYIEPKEWYLPPRQVLGAVLLEAGKAREAERAYRQDLRCHPQNGWSLYGLVLSLFEQGKMKEAEAVKKQFTEVWRDADVTLTGSRF